MRTILLHLLVEPRMEPIPSVLEVIVFDGDLRVVDEHGKAQVTGKHVGINGSPENIRLWLEPFDGVWVGKGNPALQEFEVCHVRDQEGHP